MRFCLCDMRSSGPRAVEQNARARAQMAKRVVDRRFAFLIGARRIDQTRRVQADECETVFTRPLDLSGGGGGGAARYDDQLFDRTRCRGRARFAELP